MKKISINNFLKILLVLSATFTLSACFFTARWNDKIDRQVVWSHNFGDYYSRNQKLAPEPIATDKYGSYYKGQYTGTKELNKQKYNSYIFPNLFKNSRKRFMEILLPVSDAGGVAIIRTFDQYVKHKEFTYGIASSGKEAHYKDSVYLRYVAMTASHVPIVNPKFIADVEVQWYKYYHSPNYFSDEVFSVDQPTLLDLAVISPNAEATVRYGKQSKSDAAASGHNLQNMYVCPTTTNEADALAISQQYSAGCNMWTWSYPLTTQFADLHTRGDALERDRRLGYLLTVPLDIVTFPVQAVVVAIWFPVAMMYQH